MFSFLKCSQAGEDSLRRSGLGYTIIRPGPLKVKPIIVTQNLGKFVNFL